MDYKEKYNAALERARNVHNTNVEENKKSSEYIFPELKESEDDRIKREILEIVSIAGNGNQFEEIKDWLEKQGEKGTDKVEPKFKVGDWITNGRYNRLVVGVDSRHYQFKNGDAKYIDDIDRKYHLWTIQDAKAGDIVYYECHDTKHLFIVKSVGETKDHVEGYFWYNITCNECEVWDGMLPYSNIASMYDAIPATKEQRDLLFAKMKEQGYEWDAEKKELKKIEPKFKVGDWA